MGFRFRLMATLSSVAIVTTAVLALRARPVLRELQSDLATGRLSRARLAATELLAAERAALDEALASWSESVIGGRDGAERLLHRRSGRRLERALEEAFRLADLYPIDRAALFRFDLAEPASGVPLGDAEAQLGDVAHALHEEPPVWRWTDSGQLRLLIARRWPLDAEPFLVFTAVRLLEPAAIAADISRAADGRFDLLAWRPGIPPSPDGGREAVARTGNGRAFAVIRLDPASVGHDAVAKLTRALAEAAVLGLAIALFLAVLLAGALARPLKRLATAVERVREQDVPREPMPAGPGEVGRLASSIDRMLLELHTAHRRRLEAERLASWRDVARRVAHEVKNPLTPIRLAIGNLQRHAQREPLTLAAAVLTETGAIELEIRRLERLVREFSEFARLPEPRPEPLRIDELLVRTVTSRVTGLDCEVAFDIEPVLERPVMMDGDLIATAIGNLAQNAARATSPGRGRIRVSARAVSGDGKTDRSGGVIEIAVEDDGPGVPREIRDTVFEPYVTGHGGDGTGLGLAIVRRVARDHGGDVRLESSNLGGARFVMTLPFNPDHS